MFNDVPIAYIVVAWVNVVFAVITLVLDLLALINCATRRAEAFPVVGRLSKGGWLLITGGALLVTVATGFGTIAGGGNFFYTLLIFAAMAAVLVYLLDVRPALRDVTGGRGGW